MAYHRVPISNAVFFRKFSSALFTRLRTAWVKMATCRRIGRGWQLPLKPDGNALFVSVDRRYRRQQRLRIWMARIIENGIARPRLDNATEIHDGNSLGDELDH